MKRLLLILVVFAAFSGLGFAQDGSTILLRSHGSLNQSGESYDGRLVDWYEVQIPATGRLRIVAVSVDFAPMILVRRSGMEISEIVGGRESASATRSVVQGEFVSLGVAGLRDLSSGWTGSPEYTVQAEFFPGDAALQVGGYQDGELESGDEQYDAGQYIDWYPLTLGAGQRVRVTLRSPDFDTYLIIELPNGTELQDDDGADGTNSSLSFAMPVGGTVRVGVRSYGYGDSGQYEVSVTEEVVTPISIGQTLRGRLAGQDSLYVLEGFAGQVVDVSIVSSDFGPSLEISDTDGAILFADSLAPGEPAELTYVFGESGNATISVSGFGRTGEYALTARRSNETFETPADGFRLEGGEIINGRISTRSPQIDGIYHQRFTFYADEGERVEFTLESDSFDSYLRLVDPGGFETTDDDSAGNLNSRISLTTRRAGIHEIYARPLGVGETGLFTLSFRRLADARTILSTRGQLTPNDPQDASGKANDVVEFRVEAGRSVVIDVISESFDTMATLRDQSGRVIAQDDDGGSGSNSRIAFTPERSGGYQLVVTSFSSGSYGNYRVEIIE